MSKDPETNQLKDIHVDIVKQPSDKTLVSPNNDNVYETQLHSSNNMDYNHLNEIEFKVKTKDTSAAIGPLGLMGFGLTTFLLNLENAGVFYMSPVILGMGVSYGGIAQFVAGLLEWSKGNNFTAVAFMSYGAFWVSFVLIHAIPEWGWCAVAEADSLALYLFIWFVFTGVMLGASFTKPWAVRLVFLTLTILFLLLAIGKWANSKKTTKAAGVIGILCALIAMYTGAAEILNDAWKMTVLPLGAPGEHWLGKIAED